MVITAVRIIIIVNLACGSNLLLMNLSVIKFIIDLIGSIYLMSCVLSSGHILHHVNVGLTIKQCVHQIPSITMEASVQPITRTVLRVRLIVMPDFRWNDQVNIAPLTVVLGLLVFIFNIVIPSHKRKKKIHIGSLHVDY